MATNILAIDLGKYKSVFCEYDATTRQAKYRTLRTDPEIFREEFECHPGVSVVVEACSPAGWVHDLCVNLNVTCAVANTSGAAWAWRNVKRKTDRDDALKLAQLFAIGQLPVVRVPGPSERQWKSLIGLRKRLVGERSRSQNRLRGLLAGQGLSCPLGAKAWTEAGLLTLSSHAKPLAECSPNELWRGEMHVLLERYASTVQQIEGVEKRLDELSSSDSRVTLLRTVPGVGPRTAEVIALHLGDAKRFRNGDEVSAYAGLVPRQYQSGETDRRGRITRRGSKSLRSAMVECAWCSLRYNAWALGMWQKLRENGCTKKKAVVALARKLLVRCWGVLKSGKVWRESATSLAAGPLSG